MLSLKMTFLGRLGELEGPTWLVLKLRRSSIQLAHLLHKILFSGGGVFVAKKLLKCKKSRRESRSLSEADTNVMEGAWYTLINLYEIGQVP